MTGFLLNAGGLALAWLILLFFGLAAVPKALVVMVAQRRRARLSDSATVQRRREQRASRDN
jgi:hypothetical protein